MRLPGEELTETIASGTLSGTTADYKPITISKYKRIIYNILAASSATRDLRTSGIIEIDNNNSPINPSSNFEIYDTSSFNCKGVVYLSGSSNNAIVTQIKAETGISAPYYEIIGILR